MRRHQRTRLSRLHAANLIMVDALAPNPAFDHDPLPDQILGIALDQRAFGPRQLMVAFAAYDGRFLALTYALRTDPIDGALEGCLLHFDAIGRGGEEHAAAVVLCDQAVEEGPASAEFIATFERARAMARHHGVHLVDWIACDDDMFRCARRRTFTPEAEPGWWDVPDLPSAS